MSRFGWQQHPRRAGARRQGREFTKQSMDGLRFNSMVEEKIDDAGEPRFCDVPIHVGRIVAIGQAFAVLRVQCPHVGGEGVQHGLRRILFGARLALVFGHFESKYHDSQSDKVTEHRRCRCPPYI